MSHERSNALAALMHKPSEGTDIYVTFGNPTVDQGTFWTEVLKVMEDVWKNEESRFSNLNTRALGLVSASSIVLTILSIFYKDIFESSSGQLTHNLRLVGQYSTGISVGLLLVMTLVVILGCLMPGGRSVWGNNAVAGLQSATGNARQGTVVDNVGVDRTTSEDYATIYVGLVNRNERKAFWLSWGYMLFGLAIILAAAGSVIEIFWAPIKS